MWPRPAQEQRESDVNVPRPESDPRAGRLAAAGYLLVLGAAGLWSCKGEEPKDDGPQSIPGDSGVIGANQDADDTGYSFPVDTFDGGGLDEVPENTLELRHTGYWDMTPVGGPYETIIGDLQVDELIDGDTDQQFCYVLYAMTGFGLPDGSFEGCPGCEVAFEVEFFLVEEGGFKPFEGADPIDTGGTYDDRDLYEVQGRDECRSPDLPLDGERWRMGWAPGEGTADGVIYVDYYGSDIWLPFYAGEQDLDRVDFAWVQQFGFVVPEMEE